MTRLNFCNMLDFVAAQNGHDFAWRLKRFRRMYGSKAGWPATIESLAPTVLFAMLLESIESDIAIQERATPRGGVDKWASKNMAW